MSWSETTIDMPLSETALEMLLSAGARGSMSEYSHYRIIQWLARFADNVIPCSEHRRQLINLADDATVCWELYVSSHYTLEQLQKFSLDDVILPKENFVVWLEKYKEIK